MPRKCCMPSCKGNYSTGPKVSVFYFPHEEELRRKWIRAVHRETFIPTNNSVVCELHFNPFDIERTTSAYDTKTGTLLTAPLDRPRLRKGAVPSILPGCPTYLSEYSKIEIKEEICEAELKSEVVPLTPHTIHTTEIKQENTDYGDSTACSTSHNCEPAFIACDTIQAVEIKRENTDYGDSTAHSTSHNCEPVLFTIDTIQTAEIKQENTDSRDSTACSTSHNCEPVLFTINTIQTAEIKQENTDSSEPVFITCDKEIKREADYGDSTASSTSDNVEQISPAVCRTISSAGNSKQPTCTRDQHFTCDVCNNKFSRRGDLKSHLFTHTGHKPFTCNVCAVKFSEKKNMKRHLLTHTGHKPFSCDICTKEFPQKSHLKEHMLTHTGQRSFSCDICTKRFSLKEHLKTHLLTHTGPKTSHKPFTCDICYKKFSERECLKKHLLRHEKDKLP